VFLSKLGVRNFRNLQNTEISFGPQVHLFIGDNGHGKTNILEAIYVLLKGKSFRSSKLEFLSKKNSEDAFSLNGEIQSQDHRVKDSLNLNFSNKKKGISVNGKTTSETQLASRFPVILFSPESLSFVKEGPELRRELIDELVEADPILGWRNVSNFKKCLRSRNKVLKEYGEGKLSVEKLDLWLESLNAGFLEAAVDLCVARIEALKKIQNTFAQIFRQITHHENVDISVDYVISGEVANAWNKPQIHDSLLQRMAQLRAAELSAGTSLVGPHKHEIQFLFNGNNSRFFCSQGQQRALILAFKIAQIVYHRQTHTERPILLLDDVMSELDLEKKHYLLGLLREQEENSQIFISTTEDTVPAELSRKRLSVYRVNNGVVRLES
jgi:DNA replication and repair protein RecF